MQDYNRELNKKILSFVGVSNVTIGKLINLHSVIFHGVILQKLFIKTGGNI